ncbi:hypothetical protein I552_4502 [Mycobacterium xenopi 3993]|nr:hypothetical protein I552_4502 [Mycobacterium xenopi 3993]
MMLSLPMRSPAGKKISVIELIPAPRNEPCLRHATRPRRAVFAQRSPG